MEQNVIVNSITNELTLMFMETLYLWEENPEDTFYTCWKKIVDSGKYIKCYTIKDRKKMAMPEDFAEKILNKTLRYVSDFVTAQSFTYGYEIINKSCADYEGDNKEAYEKLKKQILRENISDEKILRVIRNALAHNDDTVITRWNYSVLNETFSFSFGKNNEAVVLDRNQMLKLMKVAGNHFVDCVTTKYFVEPNPLVAFPLIDKPSKDLLKLVDRKNDSIIEPDEHQVEVLDTIVNEIRFGDYIPIWLLNLYYPFKANAFNNKARMVGLSVLLKDFSDLRHCNFDDFGKKCRAKDYEILNEYDSTTNIVSLFVTSLLFQLCSNTPNAVLNECIKGVKDDIKMSSVRNAIVHGTFFYDKKLGFHFYDGKEKDERTLKYVGYLNYIDIIRLKENISRLKFNSKEDVVVSMGNMNHPEPYKVDDEKIK